jgi:hypothetical protein
MVSGRLFEIRMDLKMPETVYDALIPDTIIFGEGLYNEATDLLIGMAERELLIFDQDLTKGDYASVRRFELLQGFLGKHPYNRLVMVLHETEHLPRRCPRLFDLLKTYGHAMTIYETSNQAKVAKDSFILVDKQHYLRRFHADQPRFRYASNDLETVNMLTMRFDELLEAPSHTLTSGKLGL